MKAGLFGTGMLAVSGIGLSFQSTVYRSPKVTLKALSDREYSIIAAAADRICPQISDMPSAQALMVADHLDGAVYKMHPAAAAEFKQLLALLENPIVGMVFEQRMRPFTACEPEVQDRVLKAWQHSRFSLRRTGFRAIAGLCMAGYWSQPETWSSLGYPGPPQFNLPPAKPLIIANAPVPMP